MQRWAIRFGYDGRSFAGWARQPGRLTIEGAIRSGIVRCGVSPDLASIHLAVASRTDRGVSARRNILALSSSLPGDALLRALNGIAPNIFFTAAAPVEGAFTPRHALWRHYRYFEPARGRTLTTWKTAAREFEGRVDVRSFGRGVLDSNSFTRIVDRVHVRRARDVLVVDVQAVRFVWGMVRKIIAGMRAVDRGELPLDRLRAGIRGDVRLTLPLAEAEPLVLWEVRLPLRWKFRHTERTRAQRRYLERLTDQVASAKATLAAFER